MPRVGTEKVRGCPDRVAQTVEFVCNEKISEFHRKAVGQQDTPDGYTKPFTSRAVQDVEWTQHDGYQHDKQYQRTELRRYNRREPLREIGIDDKGADQKHNHG